MYPTVNSRYPLPAYDVILMLPLTALAGQSSTSPLCCLLGRPALLILLQASKCQGSHLFLAFPGLAGGRGLRSTSPGLGSKIALHIYQSSIEGWAAEQPSYRARGLRWVGPIRHRLMGGVGPHPHRHYGWVVPHPRLLWSGGASHSPPQGREGPDCLIERGDLTTSREEGRPHRREGGAPECYSLMSNSKV